MAVSVAAKSRVCCWRAGWRLGGQGGTGEAHGGPGAASLSPGLPTGYKGVFTSLCVFFYTFLYWNKRQVRYC